MCAVQRGTTLAHDASVQGVTFSTDGRLLLTASSDPAVRLWSVDTGEQIGDETVSTMSQPREVAARHPLERAVSGAVDDDGR